MNKKLITLALTCASNLAFGQSFLYNGDSYQYDNFTSFTQQLVSGSVYQRTFTGTNVTLITNTGRVSLQNIDVTDVASIPGFTFNDTSLGIAPLVGIDDVNPVDFTINFASPVIDPIIFAGADTIPNVKDILVDNGVSLGISDRIAVSPPLPGAFFDQTIEAWRVNGTVSQITGTWYAPSAFESGVTIGVASQVPEPSSSLLGLAGGAIFLLRRRR